jgi:Questin oxidase-like
MSANDDREVIDLSIQDSLLQAMLRSGAEHDPYYGASFLSDHLPMALVSLRRLGASDDELTQFWDRYAKRLEPQRYQERSIVGPVWPNCRGMRQLYPGLRRYFEIELQRQGRDAVLREWLPRLIESAGIDALHPLIRTALAVEGECTSELACALAYWVSAWEPVPVDDGPREQSDPAELFHRLRAHPVLGHRPASTDMFGIQLGQLSGMEDFRRLIRWRGASVGLKNLAREAARVYLGYGHFFALHMVTGSQAVHRLAPWVADDDKVADALWMSLAAAYLIIRTPAYAPIDVRVTGEPSRTAVLRSAMTSEDEHIAKLGYSAFVQWEAWHLPEHALILQRIEQGKATLFF